MVELQQPFNNLPVAARVVHHVAVVICLVLRVLREFCSYNPASKTRPRVHTTFLEFCLSAQDQLPFLVPSFSHNNSPTQPKKRKTHPSVISTMPNFPRAVSFFMDSISKSASWIASPSRPCRCSRRRSFPYQKQSQNSHRVVCGRGLFYQEQGAGPSQEWCNRRHHHQQDELVIGVFHLRQEQLEYLRWRNEQQ